MGDQEALQAGRGSGSKAFALLDDLDAGPFVAPAELQGHRMKLPEGATPLSLFSLILAHTAFPFMPIT